MEGMIDMLQAVDFEAHFMALSYLTAQNNGNTPEVPPMAKRQMDLGENRIQDMNDANVAIQIISGPGGFEKFTVETGLKVAANCNDLAYEAIQRYPTRFRAYANTACYPSAVDQAIKELERCKERGFVGWNAHSNFIDHYVDEPCFFPLLEAADAMDMFVYLHPGPPSIERLCGYGPMLNGGLGYHVDSLITFTRLVCSGVFDKLPNLKILLGHMGEGMPFMADRVGGMGHKEGTSSRELTEILANNVWVTTSGYDYKPAFYCCLDRMGSKHMLFASDYPMGDLGKTARYIEDSCGNLEFKKNIFYENAAEFFGISVSGE